MPGRSERDIYAYLPGFAVMIAFAITLAFAPRLVPLPLRQAIGLAPDRVAPARTVPAQGTFAYLAHQPGDEGSPVGYDPCKRIKVRVNPDGGPGDVEPFVREALDHVADLSGLRFDYEGTTDERPRWDRKRMPVYLGAPRTRPVLISWATEAEVPQLEGRVAGVGGSVSVEERGHARYITGGVTLDAEVFARLATTGSGALEARAILLHELGHLVGLAHVDDADELMNEENVGLLDFGPGDRAGLARVGDTDCT
jgi:hypothetical protein